MSTDSNPTPPPGDPAAGGSTPSSASAAPPGPPPGVPARPPGEDFFNKIRALGISRPDQGRWAAGVCAGIARRLGVDPLLVRGIFVVLVLVGGMGLFLYGLGWAFLPQDDGRIHAQQALRGDISAGLVGAVVLMLLDLGRDSGPWWNFGWWHGGFFPFFGPLRFGSLVTVVVVGVVVWWLLTRHGGGGTGGGGGAGGGGDPTTGAPPPGYAPPSYGPPAGRGPDRPPTAGFTASAAPYATPSQAVTRAPTWAAPPDPAKPSHMVTQVTLGAALLAAGLATLWDRHSDLPGPTWLLAAATALGTVAVGVVVAGVLGRRAGGLAPVGILLACLVLVGAVLPREGSVSRFGAITWRPQTASQAERGLTAGGHHAVVDLTAPGITAGATPLDPVRVQTWLGVGQLQLAVPRDRPMEIRTSVGAGDVIDATGVSSGGAGISDTIHTGGAGPPLAVVNARVAIGQILVTYDAGVTQ